MTESITSVLGASPSMVENVEPEQDQDIHLAVGEIFRRLVREMPARSTTAVVSTEYEARRVVFLDKMHIAIVTLCVTEACEQRSVLEEALLVILFIYSDAFEFVPNKFQKDPDFQARVKRRDCIVPQNPVMEGNLPLTLLADPVSLSTNRAPVTYRRVDVIIPVSE